MALVRSSHCGNGISMVARSEPIEQFGPDCPAFRSTVSWVNRPFPPSNHQNHPGTHCPRLVEARGDAGVSPVEGVTVEIKRQIRRYLAGLELAVPMRIEVR